MRRKVLCLNRDSYRALLSDSLGRRLQALASKPLIHHGGQRPESVLLAKVLQPGRYTLVRSGQADAKIPTKHLQISIIAGHISTAEKGGPQLWIS